MGRKLKKEEEAQIKTEGEDQEQRTGHSPADTHMDSNSSAVTSPLHKWKGPVHCRV